MPEGLHVTDKNGAVHTRIRIAWVFTTADLTHHTVIVKILESLQVTDKNDEVHTKTKICIDYCYHLIVQVSWLSKRQVSYHKK